MRENQLHFFKRVVIMYVRELAVNRDSERHLERPYTLKASDGFGTSGRKAQERRKGRDFHTPANPTRRMRGGEEIAPLVPRTRSDGRFPGNAPSCNEDDDFQVHRIPEPLFLGSIAHD